MRKAMVSAAQNYDSSIICRNCIVVGWTASKTKSKTQAQARCVMMRRDGAGAGALLLHCDLAGQAGRTSLNLQAHSKARHPSRWIFFPGLTFGAAGGRPTSLKTRRTLERPSSRDPWSSIHPQISPASLWWKPRIA